MHFVLAARLGAEPEHLVVAVQAEHNVALVGADENVVAVGSGDEKGGIREMVRGELVGSIKLDGEVGVVQKSVIVIIGDEPGGATWIV